MIKSFCCEKKSILYFIEKEVFYFLCSHHFESDFLSDITKDISSLKRIDTIVNYFDEKLSQSRVKVNEINDLYSKITKSSDVYKSQIADCVKDIKATLEIFTNNLLLNLNESYFPYDKQKIDEIVDYINDSMDRNNKYSDSLKMNIYDNFRNEFSIEMSNQSLDFNNYLTKTIEYLDNIISSNLTKNQSFDSVKMEINEIIKGISNLSDSFLNVINKLKGRKENDYLEMDICDDDLLSNLHIQIKKGKEKNVKSVDSEFNSIPDQIQNQLENQSQTQLKSNLIKNSPINYRKESANNLKYKERSARKDMFSKQQLSHKEKENYNLKYRQDDDSDVEIISNKKPSLCMTSLIKNSSSRFTEKAPFIKFNKFNYIVSLSDTYDFYIINTSNNKINKIDNEIVVNTIKKYSSSKGINIENGKFLIVSSAPKDNKLSSNSFILSYEIKNKFSLKNNRDDFNKSETKKDTEMSYEYESVLEDYSLTSSNKKKFNLISFQIMNHSNIYDTVIFNLGGLKSLECEYSFYSNKTKKWKEFCSLNDIRTNASCAVINKKLFIFGGFNSEKQNKLGDGYLNSMEYIELEDFMDEEKRDKMKWNLIECDILDVINKSAFGVLNSAEALNSIIIFGGFNNTNSDKDVLSDNIIIVDFNDISSNKAKLSVRNCKERLFEKTCFINFNFLKSASNEDVYYSCSFNNKYYCYNISTKELRILS